MSYQVAHGPVPLIFLCQIHSFPALLTKTRNALKTLQVLGWSTCRQQD
jgi:hypothetical protein